MISRRFDLLYELLETTDAGSSRRYAVVSDRPIFNVDSSVGSDAECC